MNHQILLLIWLASKWRFITDPARLKTVATNSEVSFLRYIVQRVSTSINKIMSDFESTSSFATNNKTPLWTKSSKDKQEARERLKETKDYYEYKPKNKGRLIWSYKVKVMVYYSIRLIIWI